MKRVCTFRTATWPCSAARCAADSPNKRSVLSAASILAFDVLRLKKTNHIESRQSYIWCWVSASFPRNVTPMGSLSQTTTIHQAGLHIEVILWYLVTCQTEPNLPRISLVRSLKQFSREPACDQVEPGQHCIALHSTADGWLMYSSSLSLGDCAAPPPSWCFSASIRFFQNLLKQ